MLYISLQNCKSTHPISMGDCTYLAPTWVLKHFLCSRKRAWICHISLKVCDAPAIFWGTNEQLRQPLFAICYLQHLLPSLHLFFLSYTSQVSPVSKTSFSFFLSLFFVLFLFFFFSLSLFFILFLFLSLFLVLFLSLSVSWGPQRVAGCIGPSGVFSYEFWNWHRRRMSSRREPPLASGPRDFFSFIQNVYVSVCCTCCVDLWICWEQWW